MTPSRILVLAAACSLASCSFFKKGEENYDTIDGGGGADAAYDMSNPYGVPEDAATDATADAVPYQPVNPPADNPIYAPAAYEDTAIPSPEPAAPAEAPVASSTTHIVAKGDTLGGIARRYGVSTSAIKQVNAMTNDTVVLGRKLNIPGASRTTAPRATAGKFHTVAKGDTLGRIATRYGTTTTAIKRANGMKSDTVVLGAKLRIP